MTSQASRVDPRIDVDVTITRTIEALRSYRGISVPELQAALGMRPGTYFSRRRGDTAWTAQEVKRAADALNVSVATLYDGLSVAGAGFEPATSGLRDWPRQDAVVIPFPRRPQTLAVAS